MSTSIRIHAHTITSSRIPSVSLFFIFPSFAWSSLPFGGGDTMSVYRRRLCLASGRCEAMTICWERRWKSGFERGIIFVPGFI
ncbi:hypothetical protein CPC08DRAFT_471717 [Agrocybe pediades]|nr:hypothetical protein CPC08DRAFT_471717 [Agrocybe pediades]